MCDELMDLRAEIDNLYNVILRIEDAIVTTRKGESIPLSVFNNLCLDWSERKSIVEIING